jgi:hypothetical protein
MLSPYNKKVEIAVIQISRLFIMMSNKKQAADFQRHLEYFLPLLVCVVRKKRKLLPLFMTMFFFPFAS